MITTLALLAASTVTPFFPPDRYHSWRETPAMAAAIEETRADTRIEGDAAVQPLAQRYRFIGNAPFEYAVLLFDNRDDAQGLMRILYPVHLPLVQPGLDKPFTDVPEKFSAVREWLVHHLGEPAAFSSSETFQDAHFDDTLTLIHDTSYDFRYTWCTADMNAWLLASREPDRAPSLMVIIESPALAADPDSATGRICP